MEYTVNKLAKLAGVSTRTLRYYDGQGLLSPARVSSNGYRIYGQEEIVQLQQILFYRELGMSLDEIKNVLTDKKFDADSALEGHLDALLAKRDQLDLLIANVEKTIAARKGEINMSDKERFEGFKKQLIDENERKYGKEVREKYGDEKVDASNKKLMGLTQEQYDKAESLRTEMETTLKAAFETGDPAGAQAIRACELHREWLCLFYPSYSKEYHKGLADMYVADERFRANYDKIAPGCTDFLRDAIYAFCEN